MANFDWSRAFEKPLNGSETMNILVMIGPESKKVVAQLEVIEKFVYATLIVNQFPSYMIKFYLTGNDCNNLCLILKK